MKTKQTTRLQALRMAAFSMPYKQGNNWVFYPPWKCTDPRGPNTESRHLTRETAFQAWHNYVATIALHYMGYDGAELQTGSEAIDCKCNFGELDRNPVVPARKLLAHGIDAINAFRELGASDV